MPDSIPQDWKTDNLFVLVGGNPLPNYVATRLLLNDNGQLHLIFSEGTKKIAGKIAELASSTGCNFSRPVYPPLSDPGSRFAISEFFDQVGLLQGTVGLHYTGGTKAMAVHAFQEIKKRYPQAVCTYLDARTFELRHANMRARIPVRNRVQLTVADLVALHDIPLNYFFVKLDEQFVPLYRALAVAHTTEAGQSAYSKWCKNLRQPNGKLIKKVSHLPANHLIPYPDQPVLKPVTEAMQTVFDVSGTHFDPDIVRQKFTMHRVLRKAGNQPGSFSLEPKQPEILPLDEFVRYLDGTWVEHLTLDALRALDNKCKPHDTAMSIRTQKTEKDPYDFEFDVAAMQGYQLYAISCTRSAARDRCKSKLFEAYVRAAQLGGDEAKVGLVCCDENPEVLQKQVQSLWRESDQEIRVFSVKDLPDLTKEFHDWLLRSGGCA